MSIPIPKKIGHGEGGAKLPKLYDILNAIYTSFNGLLTILEDGEVITETQMNELWLGELPEEE